MKTVWRDADFKGPEIDYVPRCSKCGSFKEDMKVHWFFNGLYCVLCIKLRLYDDVRNIFNGEGKC